MRILIVSHASVINVNQLLFTALESLPDVSLGIVMPERWRSEYAKEWITPSFVPGAKFEKFLLPVANAGNVSLYFYKRWPMETFAQFKPDLVFSTQEPWSFSNFQARQIASRLRVPFVFETHQNIFKSYPPPFSWLEQASYRQTKCAFATADEALDVMRRKGYNKPCYLVPHATDISQFKPGREESLRRKLGCEEAVVIGYLGRLVPEKGLDILLRASVPLLKQAEPPVKLLLVGAGVEEEKLRRFAAENGVQDKVIFAGAVPHDQAATYMRCMDIFALPSLTTPSWKEQFGRVLVEAWATGLAVVGSDSGNIPFLIRDTGGGLIYPENSAEEMRDRLQQLTQDAGKRTGYGEAGRREVEGRYSCEAVARQLYGLFRDVLDETLVAVPA